MLSLTPFGPIAFLRFAVLVMACLAVTLVVGCGSQQPAEAPAKHPFEGITLKVLVVDDPALADAVAKFQGEWKAQTGASLEITQCSAAELQAKKELSADAVIYPSHWLGALDQRNLIAPLSPEMLADPRLAWPEIFEALRLREVTRDGRVLAVPLGSPVLVCYYRGDLFRQFDKEPPRTWREFIELARFFENHKHSGSDQAQGDAGWSAVMAPQESHGNALLLLAWAAPYAKHPDYFSALFDLQTMAPRVDSPPFVRALTELVSVAPTMKRAATPALVTDGFWRDQCAMAIAWASAAETPQRSDRTTASPMVEAGFCRLPGADEVYHPEADKWEQRPAGSSAVPLLSVAGRIGSVVKGSQQASAALQLLATLSSVQWSPQISSASPSTTMFRTSHLEAPRQWTETAMDQAAARRYAEVVQSSLSQQDYLSALPFAGREEYLSALDEAVQRAISGDQSPSEALEACAKQWKEITERLGIQQQRDAYRRSVEFGP